MAAILINNTALRNNGDIALVRALGHALRDRGHSVTVCGQTVPSGQKQICGLPACKDVVGYRRRVFQRPVLADAAALMLLLVNRKYRQADALIGAPGGYVNSFYGFRWKLRIYRWANLLGKKTAIYSQSVGPLSGRDQEHLRSAGRYLDVLVARDELSGRAALQAGIREDRILQTEDAVFLSVPRNSVESPRSNKVLVSVRDWQHDGRDAARFTALVHRLMEAIIARGFDIEFVSTCQGIDGYVDDSKVAGAILDSFTGDRGRISVCRERLSIEQLEQRIDAARFVLGTRLHMCLLAMMAGIPAFNISYEAKGIECYRYMGMADYSVDYNAEPDTRLRDWNASWILSSSCAGT